MSPQNLNRRAFLACSGAAALAGMGAPWAMNLAGIAQAAQAQSNTGDGYKALVCVFLQGGNDQANTVIPCDTTGFGLYQTLRGQLANGTTRVKLQETQLTPDNSASLPGGLQLALAPAMQPLLDLFNKDKKLALLLNIGPLVQPIADADAFKRLLSSAQAATMLPPKLFSHNDQQSVWQSYGAEGTTVGWGGLIGDDDWTIGNAQSRLTCVNLAGNVVYVAGAQTGQFMVNPYGPDALLATAGTFPLFDSPLNVAAFNSLTQTQDPSVHRLAKEHSNVMRRAVASNTDLLKYLPLADTKVPMRLDQNGEPTDAKYAELKGNLLAAQLNTAARMIAIHPKLGIKRQVFFVSLGGFDLHDNLAIQHPILLAKLAHALAQFDTDLQNLGMRDQVTTFTASDFGRTITSNGDGSDHGWGSHHFVMGGAVNGGRVYGEWPDVSGFEAGIHNIGQGRLLPTMAVDHLASALARWMGVTDATALQHIAPHLGNFTGVSPLADLLPRT